MRANPNYDVVKEPRGFIKCLEVFLAIFAFSCATGYRGHPKIMQTGPTKPSPKHHNAEATLQYPFDEGITMKLMFKPNTNVTDPTFTMASTVAPLDERSKIEFFVVIGVFCFLYSLGMLVYYIFFEEDNTTNATPVTSSLLSPPVIDFGLGAFWALFWFFSSCAFAAGVNNIKDVANTEHLISGPFSLACANGVTCTGQDAKYATLTVAILLGFLNVFVWCGNIWFLWKETPWHNSSGLSATGGGPSTVQQQQPPAAAI